MVLVGSSFNIEEKWDNNFGLFKEGHTAIWNWASEAPFEYIYIYIYTHIYIYMGKLQGQ
jgi:hypothetical protein